MNPRPPEGTQPGTLHWLYRPTGNPYWMVATWTGDAWNTLEGVFRRPEELVWWNYCAPATPPGSIEADHRKNAMLTCRNIVQKIVDDYVHEHFSYDPETGVLETRSEVSETYAEALEAAVQAIDDRISMEFPNKDADQ